jgi:hypothetical protein
MSLETTHPWNTTWSVTQVLRTKWPMPKYIPREALERGTRVHEVTEEIDRGGTVDPGDDILGWVAAYQAFLRDVQPTYKQIEKIIERPALDVHGIIDRVGLIDGRLCVLDIKTGPKKTADAIQLAAYAMLYDQQCYDQLNRYGLYIRKDGSYKLVQYTKMHDYVTWLQLLKQCTNSKT